MTDADTPPTDGPTAARELDRAVAIAARVLPGHDPNHSCMLVAAAVAGMRGLRLSDVRVGSLFWPERFREPASALSVRGGWGCEGFSARDGLVYLSEAAVEQDGGFAGHTWIETDEAGVVDLMHDADGIEPEIRDADGRLVAKWIRRRKLEAAVRRHWGPRMREAIRLGRLDAGAVTA